MRIFCFGFETVEVKNTNILGDLQYNCLLVKGNTQCRKKKHELMSLKLLEIKCIIDAY